MRRAPSPPAQEDPAGRLEGLGTWLYRWRAGWLPFAFGLVLAGLAAMVREGLGMAAWPGWARFLAALVPLLGGCGLGLALYRYGPRLHPAWQRFVTWLSPTHLDQGAPGLLDTRRHRVYIGAVFAAAGTWVAAFLVTGFVWPISAQVWLVLVAALGLPWWYYRGFRRRRPWNRWARRFETRAGERVRGWAGCRLLRASKPGPGTVALRVRLAPGTTITDVGTTAPALNSALGLRTGATVVRPTELDGDVEVLISPRDPYRSQRLLHPVFALTERPPGLREDPTVPVGQHKADRSEARIDVLAANTLVCGSTRGGKTWFIRGLLAYLAWQHEAALLAVDGKHGLALWMFEKVLAVPLAKTAPAGRALLRGVLRLIDHRELHGIHWPPVVVVTEETPQLLRDGCGEDLALAVARGVESNVLVFVVAQSPTTPHTGATVLRDQLTRTVSFRLGPHMNSQLWGKDKRERGRDSTGLRTGECQIEDDDHEAGVIQAYGLAEDDSDDALIAHLARCPGPVPLSEGERAALLDERGTPRTEATKLRLANDDDLVWEALGAGATSPAELAARTGLDRHQIRRALDRMVKPSAPRRVHSPARGQWQRVGG
jgi:hypothetical protein